MRLDEGLQVDFNCRAQRPLAVLLCATMLSDGAMRGFEAEVVTELCS